MVNEKIDLYEYFGIDRKGKTGGYLTVYMNSPVPVKKEQMRPAALVIPEYGAALRTEGEVEAVALKFLAEGYTSFVLDYTLKFAFPVPLTEACMAVTYIRENADKYGVNIWRVVAYGAHSGGYLAALLGTGRMEREVASALGRRAKLSRPDAVVLNNPVITLRDNYTDVAMRNIITGGNTDLISRLSVESIINNNSSPAFIWYNLGDLSVFVENSFLLASAYRRERVPFNMHVVGTSATMPSETTVPSAAEAAKSLFPLAFEWLESRGFEVR